MNNPIATLLAIAPVLPAEAKRVITVHGRRYELYGAAAGTCETLYRLDTGFGQSNPGFTLALTPASQHKMQLGNYLAGRQGVKRAEAEALVDAVTAADKVAS
jgi:hypothetical protein